MNLPSWIIYAQTFSAIITACIVFVLILQIRNSNKWRRKSHSHQILYNLVTQDFVKILNRIIDENNWDIVGIKKDYESVYEECRGDGEKITELNENLTALFRFLEAICISMAYGALDEELCREYLNDILPKIFFRNVGFVIGQRNDRGNEEIFEWVEEYAVKWTSEKERPNKKVRNFSLSPEHSFNAEQNK